MTDSLVRTAFASLVFCVLSGAPLAGASIGSGSPNVTVQTSFIDAFYRGEFPQLVTLPPLADVKALGSPGLVQEFASKTQATLKYALVTPDPTFAAGYPGTFQIFGDLYTYFNAIGVGTAGYPVNDTSACPTNPLGSCDYQLFSKHYALFVYSLLNVNIPVTDPFFPEWTAGGGIQAYGPAIAAPTSITSVTAVSGTQQLFGSGVIFAYPAASKTPSVYGITEPFNTAFNGVGGYAQLGFPTSDVLPIGNTGATRQTFENGRIELAAGGSPNVLFAISILGINAQAQGLNLTVGASATISAFADDTRNQPVTGRALSYTTTNGNVARVIGNGDSATVQAIGPGIASIYVSGEGKTGGPLVVRVGSGCCSIGQGAPTTAIAQAFQAAIDRNHAPAGTAAAVVSRVGGGYIQAVTASDGSGSQFLISQADNTNTAYITSGNLQAAYTASGGFTGPLGYPVSDVLAGGAQKFASGAALAGLPVRLVPAPIAVKFFQLGGPLSAAGSPVADVGYSTSAGGVGFVSQSFTGGLILAVTTGSHAGTAFFSSGPILARYLQLGGPSGTFGLPTSDSVVAGQVQSQTFEGGYIDLQPAASAAVEHPNPRRPVVSVSSSSAVPGAKIHIAATGFAPGATLVFSITGQPDFSVQASFGSFGYDFVIPAGAKSGPVTVQVKAQDNPDSAQATYTVTSVAASLPKLTIVSGDLQKGLPGSTLASAIVAVLQDAGGNPLPGVAVSFTGSPGASAQSSFFTDQNGQISLAFRLPQAAGVAVGSLTAASQVVSFSALAAGDGIQNFPAFVESDPQESLVTALAALFRYYQNSGILPVPNGLATPSVLHQFLVSKGGFVQIGAADLIPNPWVAAQFASAALSLEGTSLDRIRDLLNAGTPVTVLLSVTVDGGLYSGNAADAVGVAADGSILIDDPNPVYARTSLNDYLAGFSAQGHQIAGSVVGVLRVGLPQAPAAAAPFTLTSDSGAKAVVSSLSGPCPMLDLLSSASAASERFQYCDGTQPGYELDFGMQTGAAITDLVSGTVQRVGAGSGSSLSLSREGGSISILPQTLAVGGVTDSAAFAPSVAPGGLFTIFGSGFDSGTGVTVNGTKATVLAAFPFQINARIPPDVAPGPATLQVTGTLGTAAKSITVATAAPAIFQLGAQGAIVNQSGTLNSPASPVLRGQYISIYCTGLGTTTLKSGLAYVNAPVTVLMDGASVTPLFAGLAPGFIGLYQINVTVPAGLPPNLNGTLAVQEAGQTSNAVGLAIE